MIRHTLLEYKDKAYIIQIKIINDNSLKLKISIFEIITKNISLITILKESIKVNPGEDSILTSINNVLKITNEYYFDDAVEILSKLEYSKSKKDYNIDYLIRSKKTNKYIQFDFDRVSFLTISGMFKIFVEKYDAILLKLTPRQETIQSASNDDSELNFDNLNIYDEISKYLDNHILFWFILNANRNLTKIKLENNILEYDPLLDFDMLSFTIAKHEFVTIYNSYNYDNYSSNIINLIKILNKIINDIKKNNIDETYIFIYGIVLFLIFINYCKMKEIPTNNLLYMDIETIFYKIIRTIIKNKIDNELILKPILNKKIITNIDALIAEFGYLKFVDFDDFRQSVTNNIKQDSKDIRKITMTNPEYITITSDYDLSNYELINSGNDVNLEDEFLKKYYKMIIDDLFPALYKDTSKLLFDFMYVYNTHVASIFTNISISDAILLYQEYIIPFLVSNKKIKTFKVYI